MHTYLSTSDHTPVGPMALNHQAGTVKVDCCSDTIGVVTTLFHHMPDAVNHNLNVLCHEYIAHKGCHILA